MSIFSENGAGPTTAAGTNGTANQTSLRVPEIASERDPHSGNVMVATLGFDAEMARDVITTNEPPNAGDSFNLLLKSLEGFQRTHAQFEREVALQLQNAEYELKANNLEREVRAEALRQEQTQIVDAAENEKVQKITTQNAKVESLETALQEHNSQLEANCVLANQVVAGAYAEAHGPHAEKLERFEAIAISQGDTLSDRGNAIRASLLEKLMALTEERSALGEQASDALSKIGFAFNPEKLPSDSLIFGAPTKPRWQTQVGEFCVSSLLPGVALGFSLASSFHLLSRGSNPAMILMPVIAGIGLSYLGGNSIMTAASVGIESFARGRSKANEEDRTSTLLNAGYVLAAGSVLIGSGLILVDGTVVSHGLLRMLNSGFGATAQAGDSQFLAMIGGLVVSAPLVAFKLISGVKNGWVSAVYQLNLKDAHRQITANLVGKYVGNSHEIKAIAVTITQLNALEATGQRVISEALETKRKTSEDTLEAATVPLKKAALATQAVFDTAAKVSERKLQAGRDTGQTDRAVAALDAAVNAKIAERQSQIRNLEDSANEQLAIYSGQVIDLRRSVQRSRDALRGAGDRINRYLEEVLTGKPSNLAPRRKPSLTSRIRGWFGNLFSKRGLK